MKNASNIVTAVFYSLTVSLMGSALNESTELSSWLIALADFVFFSGYFYDEWRSGRENFEKSEFATWMLFVAQAATLRYIGLSCVLGFAGVLWISLTLSDEKRKWQIQNCVWMSALMVSFLTRAHILDGIEFVIDAQKIEMLTSGFLLCSALYIMKSKIQGWNREDIQMMDGVKSKLAHVYGLLRQESMYKEQDAIERVVIPVLKELGWPVSDPGHEWRVLRGDRNHNSKHKFARRRFDLNLYKNDKRLSVAFECKAASADFNMPTNGVERNDDEIAGNKSSIGQMLDQFFNPQFGIEDNNSGVTWGYTIGVWTNGGTWVIVKWGLADEALGWNQVQPGLYPRKYFSGDEFPAMKYKIVDLFPEDDCAVWSEAYKLLKQEIGFENVR